MGCTDTKGSADKNSLAQLIAEFLEQEGTCPRGDIKAFRNLTLVDAIKKAARARDENGDFYAHQWNLKNWPKVPEQAESTLLKCADEIGACSDFDVLHELVKSKLRISGASEMYWYDTAFRIGISLNVYPQKVYLHRGTKDGAEALGIYNGTDVLEMSELPAEFGRMKPYQVEDFLCIKKDVLHRFRK
jgi:hypothetical protein